MVYTIRWACYHKSVHGRDQNLQGIDRSYMSLDFLLKGIILGFSIAAPVGPIGVLGCLVWNIYF